MSDAADLNAVAQELSATRAAMADAVRNVRRRQQSFAVLSVLTVLFLVFYLGYAYHRFGGEVTPDLVAGNLQSTFQNNLPDTQAKLEDNLRSKAPERVNAAFDQLEKLPATYVEQLKTAATARMDEAMPKVQEQIYQSMQVALDQTTRATAAAGGNKPGADDEARLQTTLKAVSDVYATETMKFVDQQHATYAADALSFTDYLEHLATAPVLDKRDRLHRDMFRTIFALVRDRADAANPEETTKFTLIKPAS